MNDMSSSLSIKIKKSQPACQLFSVFFFLFLKEFTLYFLHGSYIIINYYLSFNKNNFNYYVYNIKIIILLINYS
jgi:hypothetical protein